MKISALMVTILALAFTASASDPDPLQDLCVADTNSTIRVNGFPCKAVPVAADFKSALIKNPGNTSNPLGSIVTAANVLRFQGLNTQGVSFARVDFAPGGTNPPHIHPRGTELLFLVHGRLLVGFVTTGDNKLFLETVEEGELFVFPRGLIHFQLNIADTPAFAVAGFNSQNPGASQVAKAVFASTPPIDDRVLARAFQISPATIQTLRSLIGRT
ncbi:germin-like protein 1-1 [Selaginella moellendorffii]|uniref:germin-like protein 1-1 n=1 Tax=Selaginella moellendorffii TaxID=88036 RepID=UPI000D1C4CC7|nr:germin-like protein 1-1 [Selaginella moellendorffii]|eukprot:XP_024540819.1 germin-like protein 1-1 [Selaginella moellendorffii]